MAGGSIKAETVRNDRQPWDSLPALMMADGKERGIKMTKKDLMKEFNKLQEEKKCRIEGKKRGTPVTIGRKKEKQ